MEGVRKGGREGGREGGRDAYKGSHDSHVTYLLII